MRHLARLNAALAGLALAWPVPAEEIRPLPRPDRTPGAGPALVMSSKSPVPRPAGLMRGHEMRLALAAAQRGDWQGAGEIAAGDGGVAADIIEWQRLRAGDGTFADYRAFLGRNPDWPGLDLLRKRGEATIPEAAAAGAVVDYFGGEAPQTGQGSLRLAAALTSLGETAKAEAELVRAWRGMAMSAEDEAAFLAAHDKLLAPHHTARLDRALWNEDIAGAQRMLDHVDDGWKALAAARLALQRQAAGVDALIEAVPAALAGDPGLAHDRMRWQVAKRRRDRAADMIIAQSRSAETLGRPAHWADWRQILARQEMRAGNARRAYEMASNHHLEPGSDYAELEWLAGYLALRYLDRPADALDHFRHFRAAVDTPISLGRAGYWEGRALEALGEAGAAMAAYRDGARHQTSFYGLLAAEKAGVPMDAALTGRTTIRHWRGTALETNEVFQAAGLFHRAGQDWEAARFLRHLAETADADHLEPLADYALSLGDPYLAVRVAKQAARGGAVAMRAYFPLTNLGPEALPVDEALALSIARRESEFHVAAISGAGARGLMQLMPATAQQMAGKLGLPYSRARLTTDAAYNATLGSAYLAHLIEEFGNNIVLVSVGYNAGPHRARSWIEANGDPRAPGIDVVDWIEHIPFTETRNYVMRVAESLPVYRARLSGKVAPIRLSEELKAR